MAKGLSEWEEIQQDYDDIAWHGRPWKGLISQWCGIHCCGFNAVIVSKLIKSKDQIHTWNSDLNSKRQTMRTHRNGSRKNYRLRSA